MTVHFNRVCASWATSKDRISRIIETRRSDANRLPQLAAELVQLKVDIIVTSGSTATRAAKEATVKFPLLWRRIPTRSATGFVDSLARPGGNITGLSNLNRAAKRETTGAS